MYLFLRSLIYKESFFFKIIDAPIFFLMKISFQIYQIVLSLTMHIKVATILYINDRSYMDLNNIRWTCGMV